MTRIAVVANPVSGGGRAARALPRVLDALREAGGDPFSEWTPGAGRAGEAIAAARAAGATTIALLGGDGTLHDALPALLEADLPFALLPSGGGNDFARAAGLPRDAVAAARALPGWRERRIDVGRVNGRPFATVAAVGFDAEVAEAVRAGGRRLPGTAAYLAAALTTLARYQAQPMRVTGDFGEIRGEFFLVAVGNTPTYGGGLRITPTARHDDGLLDVCLVDRVSRTTVLRLLPKLYSGGHAGYPFVRFVRSARIEIVSEGPLALYADGEPAARLPATLDVLPGALRLLAPPAP